MKIRWGIIGTGNIAHTFAGDLRESQKSELTAIASRSIDRAENFANEFGMPHFYDSVEQMLEEKVCDVVYIATPHSQHSRDMLFCLANGHHVLCEKPITVNASQLEEAIAEHASQQLFCMEAYWTLFLPAVAKARQWVQDGQIGELHLIQANFGKRFPYDPKGRLYNPQLAGGALLDIGIYPCMFGSLMFDSEAESVHAVGVIGST
ncbi:MAG: Gfo/Idh/MocA family protein, partial [Spirochaetota bacterium]